MKYVKHILFSLSLVFFISGCSIKGNAFTPNFNSINDLKDNDLKSVGVKNNNGGNRTYEVSLGRGSNVMTSPYGGTFQEYLEIALKEELKQSSIYDETSNIKIITTLLKNTLDTGLSIGIADLSANFIIQVENKEVFNRTYTIKHEWESSFAAMTAIPTTIENYPIAIQKLIDKFLLDTDVIKILKNKQASATI